MHTLTVDGKTELRRYTGCAYIRAFTGSVWGTRRILRDMVWEVDK